MHQLQWGIRLNQTEGSPRHLYLKCLAAQASPHYGTAILSHHGPLETLVEPEPRSVASPDGQHRDVPHLAPNGVDPQE